jgi:hypothetical protein
MYSAVRNGVSAYQAGQAGEMQAFANYGANSLFSGFGAATTGYSLLQNPQVQARLATLLQDESGAFTPFGGGIPNYPRTQLVDTSQLMPDPGGRQVFDPAKLARQGPFDWSRYQPIVVETEGGVSYVMNGLTRIENANRAGIYQLPAYVYKRE